jgi:hypothetical protein
MRRYVAFCRPGSDLLSRVLRRSTIGAGAFHGRVRNGNGCGRPAMTTRSAKRNIFEKLVRSFDLFFSLLNTSLNLSRSDECFWHPYRPAAVANRLAGRPQRSDPLGRVSVRTKVFGIIKQSLMSMNNENDQANRAISTGKLHALLHVHTRPINVVVFHGPDREYSFSGWFPA